MLSSAIRYVNFYVNQLIKLVCAFTCSVIESSEEVASSYTSTGAFFIIALAIATRCFSPPVNNGKITLIRLN